MAKTKEHILEEMAKAYLAMIFPGRSIESLANVRRDTKVDEAMLSLYNGRKPWGAAEVVANDRMRALMLEESRV